MDPEAGGEELIYKGYHRLKKNTVFKEARRKNEMGEENEMG